MRTIMRSYAFPLYMYNAFLRLSREDDADHSYTLKRYAIAESFDCYGLEIDLKHSHQRDEIKK